MSWASQVRPLYCHSAFLRLHTDTSEFSAGGNPGMGFNIIEEGGSGQGGGEGMGGIEKYS